MAGDSMLAFPMIINPGYESSRVKEVRVPEEEYPDWGDMELRSAYWETATAMSLLSAGSELIVMYHPKAMVTVKKHVDELYSAESGN